MTPTQAQIEAASNAMIDCMFAPHELPLDGELQGKYYETAKAALTAAAEVGEPKSGDEVALQAVEMLQAMRTEIIRLRTELAAIKNAAEPKYVSTDLAAVGTMAAINDTIERCAQEIEGRYFKHINDAVAAIRALKDKP